MCIPANLPGGNYKYQIGSQIRVPNPRETFRLMGVTDCYIDKLENLSIKDAQKYKLAGNSIVVSVLMSIFGKLLNIDYESKIKEVYKIAKDKD